MKQLTILIFLGILPLLTFAQPANDECVNRTTITVSTSAVSSYAIDLTTATESTDASCDGNVANNYLDAWYEFTMPVNGNIRVTNLGGTDGISFYDACGGTELTCFYGNGFIYNLSASTTYIMRVARRDIFAGIVNFDIQAFETLTNDECANRTPITVTTGGVSSYSVDTRKATESINGSCDGVVANEYLDAWYEFTMPVNGNIRLTNTGGLDGISFFDTCGGTELTCFYGNGFIYNLSASTTYVMRITNRSVFAGVVDFDIEAFETLPNDECVNRTPITVTTGGVSSYSVDTRRATESTDGSCDGNAANEYLDAWYEFTMPVNGNIRVTNIGGLDGISFFDACGGTELDCFYGNGFIYNLSASTTYIMRVTNRSIFAGIFDFDIEAFETLPNDECANRTPITVTTGGVSSYSVDTRRATESTDGSCDGTAANDYLDAWYEFTMPVNGNIQVTNIGGLDGISFFDACGGTELDCFYGNGFIYNLSASTTYIMRVTNRSTFAGNLDFDIRAFETLANDECVNRTPILVSSGVIYTYTVDTRKATESIDGSCDGNASNDYLDAWYEFTMPVNGNVHVTNLGGLDGISLYDSCGGTELTCFYGNGFMYNLSASTTYVLRVTNRSNFAGVIDFDIEAFETIENDICNNAELVNVGIVAPTDLTAELRGATESVDSSCETASQIYHDAWYEITMPVDGNLEVTNVDGLEQATLYDACGGTELNCFFNDGTFFNLTSGSTYFLRVSERDVFVNQLAFSIQAIEAPLAPCSTTTEFTGGAWNNGVPDITTNAIIRSNYDTSVHGSFTACSLAIDLTHTLTVAAGDYVDVAFDITVAGAIDVHHEGSLVQRDDTSVTLNNGTINVYVDTPALDGRDFMLMGSPMSTETRDNVFNAALRVRNHETGNFMPNAAVAATSPGAGNWVDEEGDDWLIYSGAITPGEGYMIMRSLTGPAASLDLKFSNGTLNNGLVSYTADYNTDQNSSPNIIANPYASPILADDFINANATIVDAVYFWEHKTSPNAGNPGPYGLDYTMEDISIYNLTGGTAAAGSDPGTTPNGIISTGQGFGIKALAAGNITFSNVMRRTTGNTTLRNQERDRIWLNVQSDRYELNSTALIGFMAEATDAVDIGYDAKRLATNVALYSHLPDGSDQLGIQARGVFVENVKIPMGFATLIDEAISYTISIEDIQGLNLGNATAYLIDNHTNTITNLSETVYTFESEKGIFDNRFTLQFTPEIILGNQINTIGYVTIYPNPSQGIVTISSPKSLMERVEVIDMLGRLIQSESFSGYNEIRLDISKEVSATYFVSIYTSDGVVIKRLLKE